MTKAEIIETINKMDNQQQTDFYNLLRKNGLTEDEIRTIQAAAFFAKLYSNPELYHALRDEMGHRLYKEFTK